MRIAIIGTGGIGGPYGTSLAKAGADVTFVARGTHLTAIRENGLRIEGDRGETHSWPAQATDDIASIGTVDVVLSCVKLWDVARNPISLGNRPAMSRYSSAGRVRLALARLARGAS
jgi:2-dehydropantoate 2-reductase